jgi:hypothetical protein
MGAEMQPEAFTWGYIADELRQVKAAGRPILRLVDYVNASPSVRTSDIVVLRVDVDVSLKKGEMLCEIFNELGIKATFFIRLHAKEYNPFDFENYRILRFIRDSGHEIGLHTEVIDQAKIWREPAEVSLRRDLDVLASLVGGPILGAACHSGLTGNNNLDFWKGRSPSEFGLLYEGYDETEAFGLFGKSRYVSDSEWTRWKAYNNNQLMQGDRRKPSEHLVDNPKCLYLLLHSDTYYTHHIYE